MLHGTSVCRRQDELFFVSERDGNMELYNRRVKNEMSSKHSYERMTSDPSMQVGPESSIGICSICSLHVLLLHCHVSPLYWAL